MRWGLLAASCGLIICLVSATSFGALRQYTIQNIGVTSAGSDGHGFSTAVHIGSDGTVVGWGRNYENGVETAEPALVWKNGVLTQVWLDRFSDGYMSAWPYAVSGDGTVLLQGAKVASDGTYEGERAFLWRDGAKTLLDPLSTDTHGVGSASGRFFMPDGSILGTSEQFDGDIDMGNRVVRWTQNGVFALPQLSPGFGYSDTLGSFNRRTGTIFGRSTKRLPDGRFGDEGVVWMGNQLVECPPEGQATAADHTTTWSSVNAVNDSNVAVGSFTKFGGTYGYRAAAWENGVLRELPTPGTRLDGYAASSASGINNVGDIVGSTTVYVDGAYQGQKGVIWKHDGTMQLTNLPTYTTLDSMNQAGQAIGTTLKMKGSNTLVGGVPIFFEDGTTMLLDPTILINAGFYTTASASVLREDGTVFGTYRKFTDSNVYQVDYAFMWTKQGGMVNLDALVEGGVFAAGWDHLAHISEISPGGIIVGDGVRLNGETQGFVLLPEPSAVAITAGGIALGLALKRRRGARTQ
jgi:uncharacterized membrane protein